MTCKEGFGRQLYNLAPLAYILESGVISFRHPYLLEAFNDGRLVIEPSLLLFDELVTECHALKL